MDCHLAYSLEYLELLVEKLKEFDVVIGYRNLDPRNFRNVTLLIKISGKIVKFISGIFSIYHIEIGKQDSNDLTKYPPQKL